MGARGPKPGTGGRPRKPLAEKLLDGNPGKRSIYVLKNYTELEGVDMPDPKEYLKDAQKDGKPFEAESIYNSVYQWLEGRQCAQFVSPELVEHYALSAARLIQCERCISTFGFLAKNSQGNAITSPYITIAQTYMKQANTLWAMIYTIVRENCSTEYTGSTPQDDIMERLLTARRG
jgi:hypothetical protein